MRFWEILLLAIALGIDTFSVGMAVGTASAGARQMFRLSWHFGLFQFFMPLLGWQFGAVLATFLGPFNRWLALLIFFFVGARMIQEGIKNTHTTGNAVTDRTRGWSLVLLSLATSMDAFGTGIGLGLLVSDLLYICIIIGVTAAVMTFTGMLLGNLLHRFLTFRSEIVGGVLLWMVGFKMFA